MSEICAIVSSIQNSCIFAQTFLELIFASKIKTILLKQPAVLLASRHKSIAYIMCLNT